MSAPQIAAMWMTDESHVRKVIHEFNERGLKTHDLGTGVDVANIAETIETLDGPAAH